jgi:hypothetical protein
MSQGLTAIALQATLALSYLPELVEDAPPTVPRKPRQKLQREKSLHPRWIGRDFVRAKRSASAPRGGRHASPITHWRRGHWRQQACGEGRDSRKLIWIRPVLVEADRG